MCCVVYNTSVVQNYSLKYNELGENNNLSN